MVLNNYDIIVVGCGLSGVVIAERFSQLQNKKVLIIDKRNHIGGNCYDYYDEKTNILMNKYGAHLFHTNDEKVFEYINKFSKWEKWEHKVLGLIDNQHLPIPPNITTVNKLFNLEIKSEEEMNEWLTKNQVKYDNITNGEEMAKSRVGEILYEKIFKHYTYKQWKKYPNELAPEVLARIPVRNTFDDRYFSDNYQVLPEKGYTSFFQSILDKHKDNIDVKLNFDFFDIKDEITKDQLVIYTGPIDAYFADKGLPKLEYRSIDFHIERKMNTDFYQPYSVVNYPSADTPYTRCVEYKHFLNQESDHTVYVKETTTDKGEPYYPVLNDKNKELYEKYQKMAEEEGENIHFLGRLASYKYFNMDQAIKNSLDYYEENFEKKKIWMYVVNNNDNRISSYLKDLQEHNQDYLLTVLDDNTISKFIDITNLNFCKNIKNVPLRSDFIRLYLLYHYGGVWMDCSVLTNFKIKNIKYNIFINSLYTTNNELDFIESSYLNFKKHNIVIKKLFDLFKYQLTLKKYSIYEGVKGEKIKSIYQRISDNIGTSTKYWCNYLIIYGCHSWLYHYDIDYNIAFKKLNIGDYNSMGYHIHNSYNWNMNIVFREINKVIGLGIQYFIKLSFSHLKRITHNKLYQNKNIFKLVIARYNECIKWSNVFSGNRIIYNKGLNDIDDKIIVPGDEYYSLPNIGRESHTFLHYIINNYDNIPEFVAFSQGSLKDHEWIRKDWGKNIFLNMLAEAKIYGFSEYKQFSGNIWNQKFDIKVAKKYDKNVFDSNISFINFFKKIGIYDSFNHDEKNDQIKIYPSAFMIISKKNILSRSKSYYEDIIKYCNYHLNPIEGHYFERSWAYIFNVHKELSPQIRIYCNERKRVWFKDVNKCTNLIENPNTYIIYTKNGEQKILPGVDYVGPDLLDKPCSDLEQAKDLTLTDREFYFYIRGHIRNSFNTDRLKNFVKLLKLHFPNIKFILQTWKHTECKNNESWRQINEDNTIISKQIIENYFEDKNITEQCLIIDDDSIELIGSTNGTIGRSHCPKMGWKNMWYGIYKGLEHIDISSSNNIIVSFRYDYFDIDQSADIDEEKIIQFINNNLDNKNIQFIKYKVPGTDNLYMGRYNKIKSLIEKFNFKLDNILNINKEIIIQEYLVNIIAEKECDKDNKTAMMRNKGKTVWSGFTNIKGEFNKDNNIYICRMMKNKV